MAAQLVDAVATIIQAAKPGLAEFDLMPAGDPAGFPAVHLFDRGEDVTRQYADIIEARLVLVISGYVMGSTDASWRAARTLDADIIGALSADPQLGGLAVDMNVGGLDIETIQIASKGRTTAIRRQIVITYTYRATDPTVNF